MRWRFATRRPSPTFSTTMWCGPSADLFDILPFCGQRIGKGLVMKLLGHDSPTLLSRRHAKTMLVDGDRAAVLGRLTATKRASGQAISYRIAQFIQFRDEKVVDSFDAVQQLLGYNLDADDGYRVEGNVVTVCR
jgi:hypothetical protein